jgi:transcriptional regulator with XRE-family HTH domain
MDIGSQIRKLRNLNNKMSQEELAYKLGFAQTTVSNIESNKVNPDFSTIVKICTFFDVGLEYFFENIKLKQDENINSLENLSEKQISDFSNKLIEQLEERIKELRENNTELKIKLKKYEE